VSAVHGIACQFVGLTMSRVFQDVPAPLQLGLDDGKSRLTITCDGLSE
jgi:hypothetical protein